MSQFTPHLRATRNMAQEQPAMLLGVSRQSVTKWEAEKSYPEMDKLIKICQLFACTLDDLVTGDPTQRPSDDLSDQEIDAPSLSEKERIRLSHCNPRLQPPAPSDTQIGDVFKFAQKRTRPQFVSYSPRMRWEKTPFS